MPKLTEQQKATLKAHLEAGGSVGMALPPGVEASTGAAADASASERGSRISGGDKTTPSTSRGNSLLRGTMMGLGDAVNPAAQFIMDRLAFTPSPIDANLGETVGSDTGIPAATDRIGKDLEHFGRGVGGSIPFAPLAAAGAPAVGLSAPGGAALELGVGGLAGLAQGELTDAGHPNLGMAGGLAMGAVANPAAAVSGVAARKGASNLIDSVRLMTPEALAMARANELSRGAMVRGSSEVKRRVGDIPATIDELRRRITQSAESGLPHAASSRQIVEGMPNGRGGRFFTDAERNLTTTDVDYAREASVRFADNADALARRWDRLAPGDPDFDTFLASYDEGSNLRDAAERQAWAEAMGGEQPQFGTADMVGKAKQIVGSAYFKSADVPGSITKLANGEMTRMDLPRFQELRSVLLGVIRDARRTGLSKDKHAAAMAADMLEMMGNKMDEFARNDPTGKSEAWARARQLTVENKALYDPDSPVIRTLDRGGKAQNLFEVMRRATGRKGNRTNPVEEAQRLVRIAEQTPGGMENLRALAAEDLFREGFNPTAVRQPEKILRRNEEMYRVIFGEHYDEALQLVDLAQLHTRGEAGTAAEAYRTGSGVSPAAFLFGLAKSARNPVQAAVEGAMKLTGKSNARELEWQKIVRTSIEQPEFLRVLLEMPTERALPEWQVNWRRLVAASSAREASKAAARRTAFKREES